MLGGMICYVDNDLALMYTLDKIDILHSDL